MIEILTREQFRDYFEQQRPGLGQEDSALWEPEHFEPGIQPSGWFVHARTLGVWDKTEFWSWCRRHCRGSVLCYSMDQDLRGWWGFERREDILIWVMRWAG